MNTNEVVAILNKALSDSAKGFEQLALAMQNFGAGISHGIAKGIKPLSRKSWQRLWNSNRRRRHIVNALNRTKERV